MAAWIVALPMVEPWTGRHVQGGVVAGQDMQARSSILCVAILAGAAWAAERICSWADVGPRGSIVIVILAGVAALSLRLAWAARELRVPIARLADAIEDVAAGDLRSVVPRFPRGAARRMSRSLRRVVRELRRSRLVHHGLARMLDAMNCGLLTLDSERRIRSANAPLARVLGCEVSSLLGRPLAAVVERGDELVELAAEEQGPVEVLLRAPDGSSVPALLSYSRAGADNDSDAICVLQETRALREVEDRLQRINVRLWLLNQVTNIALRSRDLDAMLASIGTTIRDAGAFSGVAFAVHDQRDRSIRIAAAAGFDAAILKVAERQGRSSSLPWHVVSQREPMILHLGDLGLDLEDARCWDGYGRRRSGCSPCASTTACSACWC